jgi:uncharacterized protein with von Willebrand factor type A (vWA) domain
MSATAHATLTARMIGFGRHLRLNDFAVGPTETEASLALVDRLGLADAAEVRQNLKSLLAGRRDEWERFDDLFEAYWHGRGRERRHAEPSSGKASEREGVHSVWSRHFGQDAGTRAREAAEAAGADTAGGDREQTRLVASAQTSLARVDLRHIADPGELKEAERLAFRLAAAMRYRLSRRYRSAVSGARLDFRRTIRKNIAHGGEPVSLAWRARPQRPVRVVVLVDVSGSMRPYARVFLQFVRGLVSTWIDTDAYLLHTRLVRISDALKEKDAIAAMSRLALMAEGFGGGTRLGACLQTFNSHYARRAINSRTVVMILSDGYDTDPPERLGAELARLKRRARRIVWLNPALGWRGYEPITRAMAAALPLIDHFAVANTLHSLAAVERDLAAL